MKTYTCPHCGTAITTRAGNYKKHVAVCTGTYAPFVKSSACKYCGKDFKDLTTSERANHSRWCEYNPKRAEYVKNFNNAPQLRTPEAVETRKHSLREAHARGAYEGAAAKAAATRIKNGTNRHTEESRRKISEKALASNHRRLLRSIRTYVKKDGSTVMLDSSWEEALAVRLDELGVEWIRPDDPIPYVGKDGKIHKYFPDFYLPEWHLFLDPKNPIAVKSQQEKLDILVSLMDNLIIIKSLDECKNYTPAQTT